jgi:eukaryotic-like serine/threonine-protein kinase
MKCPHCGMNNQETITFCVYCDLPLETPYTRVENAIIGVRKTYSTTGLFLSYLGWGQESFGKQTIKGYRNLLLLAIVLMLVSSLIIGNKYLLLYLRQQQYSDVAPPLSTSKLGLVKAPDVGLSDGQVAFDVDPQAPDVRSDSDLKKEAAQKLQEGDTSSALSLWQEAIDQDPTDAEARIYLEDQRLIISGQPYITFVIGISFLTQPYSRSISRDILQGVAIAQKEYNEQIRQSGGTALRLLISNAGDALTNQVLVARQIADVQQHTDKTIKGVIGWSTSARSLNTVETLTKAQIPLISQSASSDLLTGISPYFFRVVPPSSVEGMIDAKYVEQELHAKRVVVFEDPADSYSQNTVHAFEQQFTNDGNTITHRELYKTGEVQDQASHLDDALTYQPDLLYIPAPKAADMQEFLAHLPTSGPFAHLQVMGGEATYDVKVAPDDSRMLNRVYFSAPAYPDEWHLLNPTATEPPPFFTRYVQTYDPDNQHQGQYGFSRPSGFAMVSYDATLVLLEGSKMVMRQHPGQDFNGSDLQQALQQVKGNKAVQGVSGQISFDKNNDPVQKAIVILRIDGQAHIQLVDHGLCYIKKCV